jgi:hypothetical protein
MDEIGYGEFIKRLIGAAHSAKLYTLKNPYRDEVIAIAVGLVPGLESVSIYKYDFDHRPQHEVLIDFFFLGSREEEIEEFEEQAGKPLRVLSPVEIYELLKDRLVCD